MWQRSTLSHARSAQGSRNAHFINRRQEGNPAEWFDTFITASHISHIQSDITVRFETCHRRHRPHRSHRSHSSHSSHTTHRVSRKKAGFRPETPVWDVQLHSQHWTTCILYRETRLNTNYNDWMTKIRNIAWKQHFYTYIASTAFNQ